MSHFEVNIDLEGSCSAKLSNLLNMPERIEIPATQSGVHDTGYNSSNHTTPLNYMRRETPTTSSLKDSLKQMTTLKDLERDGSPDVDKRFQHLAVPNSTQSTFFEFHNSLNEPLEALEASNGMLIQSRNSGTDSFGENKWSAEEYGLELSSEQLGYNSNGNYSHSSDHRYDVLSCTQHQQMGINTKTETPGLGMLNKSSGYLVIGPDGNGFASELDSRRSSGYTPNSSQHGNHSHYHEQQPQGLYGNPSSALYSSTANTPRESWNMQNSNGTRKPVPASPSTLSSYATAQQPSTMLNKYNQAPSTSSQSSSYNTNHGQDLYSPAARSPHYGEEAGRPLYSDQRGVSPKYATAPGRTPPGGYYTSQQAPDGYGAAVGHAAYGHGSASHSLHHPQQTQPYPHQLPPPQHYNQLSHTGYYPPGGHAMPPLQPPVQPDMIYQVQFKRISRCFTNRSGHPILVSDFVVVEGDRGEDIGVVIEIFSIQEFMHRRVTDHRIMGDKDNHSVDCILRLATIHERQQLPDKFHAEKNIVQACNELAMYGFGLPIMVYDAEFQFDRNKLTIYYECHVRIDFRDFVRQLFSTYKARIWMKIGNANTPLDVQHLAAMALATGVQFSSGGN